MLKLKDFEKIKKEIYKLEEFETDKFTEWQIFCVIREIFNEKGQKIEERCEVKEFLLDEASEDDLEKIVAYFDFFAEQGPPPGTKFFRHAKGFKKEEKRLQKLWDVADLHLCECKPIGKDLYRLLGCYSREQKFLVLVSGFKKPSKKKFRQECERAIKILKRLKGGD